MLCWHPLIIRAHAEHPYGHCHFDPGANRGQNDRAHIPVSRFPQPLTISRFSASPSHNGGPRLFPPSLPSIWSYAASFEKIFTAIFLI